MRTIRPIAALLLFSGVAIAVPDTFIGDYFQRIQGFGVRLTDQGTGQGPRGTGLAPDVLREYGLVAWTRWEVRPADDSPAFSCIALETLSSARAYGLLSHWAATRGDARPFAADNGTRGFSTSRGTGVIAGPYVLLLPRRDFAAESDESDDRRLASLLAAAIPEENVPPVTVLNLPTEGLLASTVRNAVGPLGARSLPGIPASILGDMGFDPPAEVTRAEYQGGRTLLLAALPTPALAKETGSRIEETARAAGWRLRTTGILVALAPVDQADPLVDQVAYTPKIQWIHDDPKPRNPGEDVRTLYGVLIRWVYFTVAFIGATLLGGGLLAAIRSVVRRNSATARRMNETIRLGLTDP